MARHEATASKISYHESIARFTHSHALTNQSFIKDLKCALFHLEGQHSTVTAGHHLSSISSQVEFIHLLSAKGNKMNAVM